jgi:cytidylate kinase
VSFVVAIDGPAASGKGTISRGLAERLGFAHLDTGALYRAVAVQCLAMAGDPSNPVDAAAAAARLETQPLDDPALRSAEAGAAASKVATHPEVRAALLDYQRRFAQTPPGGASGAVLDGRDIGTVVCPDAAVKLFVVASPDVRARRRHKELEERGEAVPFERVLADIEERDRRDAERATAPLKPAADAHLLDTSELSIPQAIEAALAVVERARVG